MKTVKKLNIKGKPDYFFTNMINVNDFDPNFLVINEFRIFENRSTMFEINYFQENNTPKKPQKDVKNYQKSQKSLLK